MSPSLNKVQIIGHVGKPPEMRFTPSGVPVTTFSVACSERWKDANGAMQEKTEWCSVVAWQKLAETCNQYLKKGSAVYIEGKLQTRTWEKDGQKHYKTEIVASSMLMLDRKPAAAGAGREVADPDDQPFS